MKEIKVKDIKITEPQDSRVWIHSDVLGFGKWVYANELRTLISRKAPKDNRILCVRDNAHALTIGKWYEVKNTYAGWIEVIDDQGSAGEYPDECFDMGTYINRSTKKNG